jgi:hypothetical protein
MGAGHARDFDVIELSAGAAVDAALAHLRGNANVRYAEQDVVLHPAYVSNDSSYTNGSLWGMYGDGTTPANQYGSQAGEAWAAGNIGSSSVVVGIIDEGIDYNHPDLAANIWSNPGEIAGDGIDNDADGYIDDIHGWDFANGDSTIFDGTATDGVDRHGTHVAGTIGAVGGNGIGVAGVAWNVTMISAKFLGPAGGYSSNAVKALDYLTMLKTRYGVNIVASNNSWTGGGYSQALDEALSRAANAGILFVAASGNGSSDAIGDDNDTTANYPSNYSTTTSAGYESVIAVAATDRYGNLAAFSNYGMNTVDLGAPGVSIYSTLPFNAYGYLSGTSMATPHVTGAVALYAAAHPDATAAEIRAALLSAAQSTPTASLAGKTVTGGRLNLGTNAPALPTLQISDVSASEGNSGSTQFTFTVFLSGTSTQAVSVNYVSANGTAAAGSDYTALTGVLNFAAGEMSKTITVNVAGDMDVENDETFFVNLSAASGATIADGQALGTILNDDTLVLPTVAIGDVSANEGNGGTTSFTFTVTLSAASSQTVSLNYATSNGTASAGNDYAAISGMLYFGAGETNKTLTVSVAGDTIVESNETFFINLSGVNGATLSDGQAVGTIMNDDSAPPISLPTISINSVSAFEGNNGNTGLVFTVSLSAASTQMITVAYATANDTATLVNKDYKAASGVLTFAPGVTSLTIQVNITGDKTVEADERFFVNLSSPSGGTLGISLGVGTILNDDGQKGASLAQQAEIALTEAIFTDASGWSGTRRPWQPRG